MDLASASCFVCVNVVNNWFVNVLETIPGGTKATLVMKVVEAVWTQATLVRL